MEREDDRHLDGGVAAVVAPPSSLPPVLLPLRGAHHSPFSLPLYLAITRAMVPAISTAPVTAATQMMTVVVLMSPRSGLRLASSRPACRRVVAQCAAR